MDHTAVVNRTRHWISTVVIGLNLCPFAQRVFTEDKIRYVVTDADNEQALLQSLSTELKTLASAAQNGAETTLLIHPLVLGNFLDYVDFLKVADQRIGTLALRGIIQLASFHPHYQFAETHPDAVENYTNRSPFPMLHLLREESISKVARNADYLQEIPRRNKQTLREIGVAKIQELLKGVSSDEEKLSSSEKINPQPR